MSHLSTHFHHTKDYNNYLSRTFPTVSSDLKLTTFREVRNSSRYQVPYLKLKHIIYKDTHLQNVGKSQTIHTKKLLLLAKNNVSGAGVRT